MEGWLEGQMDGGWVDRRIDEWNDKWKTVKNPKL